LIERSSHAASQSVHAELVEKEKWLRQDDHCARRFADWALLCLARRTALVRLVVSNHTAPDGLRLGLIFVEFCFCLFTFLLLLIALLMSVAASWSSVDSEVSVAPKSEHAIRDDGSDETK
jgi:hypothetical protein